MEQSIFQAADLIAKAVTVVVFTGAGISTESGIPDFRGPGGLWTKYDPDDFTIDKFLGSHATRKKMWQRLREGGLMEDAKPNAAHYAIVELEKMGKLLSLVTQNVDNLHQKAGTSEERIRELHGNMQRLVCLNCGTRYPISLVREHYADSDAVPACEYCRGILKPDVIFFGEALPQQTLAQAMREAGECDVMLVIGSSLVVYPAAYVPVQAKQAGAKLVIINRGPTEQDHLADVRIDAAAGETLTKILERLKTL
ncbi:MAG: Sir2 family NAD-dependent protein deacetylase [Deltaproteobacteria bacterium]|jgi:NAD-dependent deacetylase|nr:Sir2 family NAD-dependent protein deacetylase [Syntrophaceae bacterium]